MGSNTTQRRSSRSPEFNDGISFAGKGLKLDSEANAKEVVDAITNCPNMVTLCLEGNTVGVEAAKAIGKALEGQPNFKKALWRDMFTGRLKTEIPQALNFLSSGILLAKAQLTELDLSDNAFGPIGVEGIVVLLKSPACYSLKELRLNNNGLGITGGKLLASALRDCLKNSDHLPHRFALRVLVCGRNRLEVEGAQALAQVFKALGSLEEVSMPQNGITHVGIAALAEALSHNSNLKIINLNDNTFTEKGARDFAKNLPKMSKLESINFGDCLIKNEGALELAAALNGDFPCLKELNLGFNEIGVDGGLAIVKAMEEKALMKKLELNGNWFGVEGCGEIQETLQAMGKNSVLGSLSDDEEGGEEDDSENEKEEDDDAQVEEIPEEVLHPEETPDKEISITEIIDNENIITEPPTSQCCTVEEFLSEPTSQRLLGIGNNGANQFLDELGNKPTFDDLLNLFTKVVSVVTMNDTKTKTLSCEIADALLGRAFELATEENSTFILTNSLLVHLGLIKCEDKKFKPIRNLHGPFIILEHCVRQPYFDKSTREILQLFVSRPNDAITITDKATHSLKQTLFQL